MLPMYQSEAMWLHFASPRGYPFAVKVATGKINAVTGEGWRDGLNRGPQDYLPVPEQPWLDGYCVEKGFIRQFVAMPLGAGYSAEEQVTGTAEHGGVQVSVVPLQREAYERLLVERSLAAGYGAFTGVTPAAPMAAAAPAMMEMGLAPGGRMRQEIRTDRRPMEEWDQGHSGRCFVHIANSLAWRQITHADPPTAPRTAADYTRAGLPWFDLYEERRTAVDGSGILARLRSVLQRGKEKGEIPLPENTTTDPARIIHLRQGLGENQVREGAF
jgi:hypothetical protein